MTLDPVALAHQVSTCAAYEAAVLAGLARDVGFDVAFFASHRGGLPTTVGVDAGALARALAAGTHDAEVVPIKRAAFAARGVAVDTDVLPWSFVLCTRYHRDFAARVNGRHSLLAFPTLRALPIGGLMLGRTGRTFTARERALVEDALPAIALGHASFARVPPPVRALQPGAASRGLRGLFARDDVLARRTLATCELVVRDRAGYREMVARSQSGEMVWTRASLADAGRSGWPYVELLHLAASAAGMRRRALFLGCGGGVVVHQFARVYPGLEIDVVESEAAVVELARAWFSLDEIENVTVHVTDGVRFVAEAPRDAWDVVIIDAYAATSLASGFASRSFFAAVARALTPGGAMAFNVVGALSGGGPVRDVVRAARAELADVRVIPVVEAGEALSSSAERNVVVVGTRRGT